MSDNVIKISVRNLVEFVLRQGSIESKFMGMSRAVEGTRIHQMIQKDSKEKAVLNNSEYLSEAKLIHSFRYEELDFIVEGRADGIIKSKDNAEIIIDEIKSTNLPLLHINEDMNELHWAQAKCYAYIYALQNNIEFINVQLTYYSIPSEGCVNFKRKFELETLKNFFYDVINKYIVWAKYTLNWELIKNVSIKNLDFPFEKYRLRQRELAILVYKTIVNKEKVFIEAPTGTGKTISTLFPSIKALGEGYGEKIFYLTAKNVTARVCEESIEKMRNKGLKIKNVNLTAKEKICFNDKVDCNKENCTFAKGHFDRVNAALLDALNNEDNFTREIIQKYSRKYNVCPFEFSLDLTLWADLIICDYNYVFDPNASLKRFSEDKDKYILLIDEAHNLVDRSREMFSAKLNKNVFLELKKSLKDRDKKMYRVCDKINSNMVTLKKEYEEQYTVSYESPNALYMILKDFIKYGEKFLMESKIRDVVYDNVLQTYFDITLFLKIFDAFDEKYCTYMTKEQEDFVIKLFCIDASNQLKNIQKLAKATIIFSATLSPVYYYRDMLGGDEDDKIVKVPSPFNKQNLCLLIANKISTKFKNRENNYTKLASYINSVLNEKQGNYMVFFPSYSYMNQVYEIIQQNFKLEKYNYIIQKNDMNDEEKEEFLKCFENENNALVGFAVMGGMFSEGIDLKGDKLIGVIIVGVGLPQICSERDIIKDYFDTENKRGYEYSYMYPGMNKVLQASGRVIRTENDKGVVLLVDDRFTSNSYKNIFPINWSDFKVVTNTNDIKTYVQEFWK
jgi:DNA excision repair protein ERCC-2